MHKYVSLSQKCIAIQDTFCGVHGVLLGMHGVL